MLRINNLSKTYAGRLLFKEASFSLSPGERLAIVGRNGTGKSTLFRLILGEEHADEGEVFLPRGYRVGHLSQHLKFTKTNILDEACLGLPPGSIGEEYKAQIILSGLGFTYDDFSLPASAFSGGFQIRIELARVLLSQPNLLLLDEPTNYLDIVSARWLERFLRSWPGEMIIISHDRTFLDSVSTHTMLIHRGRVRRVEGNTAKLYGLVEQDEEIYEQTRLNQLKKRKEMEEFVAKFKAKAGTAALAQSRQKMLDKMEVGEELHELPELEFEFLSAPFFGRTLIEAQDISFAYPARDKNRAAMPIVEGLTLNVGPRDRIGVIGKNGRGKSTLLKLLAEELKPDSGVVKTATQAITGYFGQTNIQRLNENNTVEDEIWQVNQSHNRTKVRAIAGTMMFPGDEAMKKIRVLSGGERSRVLLAKMLAQPTNLLLLDEPTNHLDVESVGALVESLHSYSGAIVLVTHDEFMLRQLAKRLVVFTDEGARVLEGDYDYFLDTIGWGEDDEDQPSDSKGKQQTAATQTESTPKAESAPKERLKGKEARRERAEQRKKRAETLKPLEQQIVKTEETITSLERSLKKLEQEIVSLSSESTSNNGGKIAELSKKAAEIKTSINRAFEELSILSHRRDELLAAL